MRPSLSAALRLTTLTIAVLAIGVTGCGESKQIPVSGKILLDGKPITVEKGQSASVNFYGGEGKAFGIGEVKENGEYTASSNNKPGLPAGTYKVTVTYSKPKDSKDPYSVPVRLINEKFTSAEFTELKIEVKDNAPPDSYDLKVTK